MTGKNENRRVRMTKRMIKDALLELMQGQDLINISVTAICETADVNRSTFYNYYKDRTDVLWDIEQDFLDRIPAPPAILDPRNQKSLLAATANYFDYIKDNKKTVQILFSESVGNDFTTRLVNHLCKGYIPVEESDDELTARFKQLYIANGTVGMLCEWINADFPVSSEKISEMMYAFSRRISQY